MRVRVSNGYAKNVTRKTMTFSFFKISSTRER